MTSTTRARVITPLMSKAHASTATTASLIRTAATIIPAAVRSQPVAGRITSGAPMALPTLVTR